MIKYSLLLLFIITTFLGKSVRKDIESKSYSSYFYIVEKKTDSSLAEGTSQCRFNFKQHRRMYDHYEIVLYQQEIRMGINEKEVKIIPDSTGKLELELKSGKYIFFFLADGFQEVVSDTIELKSQESINAEIQLFDTTGYNQIMVLKPVIYVYPEKETEINIKLNVNGNLGFTYPVYNEGWNFTASPDGNIKLDNKQYNYLFWESEMPKYALDKNDKTGFLVATDTLLPFLENSLLQMGFNAKESADFITFWYPRMMMNEKNFVKFLFNESCDAYAELKITPQPEHIFRVGMVWTEATTDFIPEKQIIHSLNRKGFTVLEWGGMIDKTLFTNEN